MAFVSLSVRSFFCFFSLLPFVAGALLEENTYRCNKSHFLLRASWKIISSPAGSLRNCALSTFLLPALFSPDPHSPNLGFEPASFPDHPHLCLPRLTFSCVLNDFLLFVLFTPPLLQFLAFPFLSAALIRGSVVIFACAISYPTSCSPKRGLLTWFTRVSFKSSLALSPAALSTLPPPL